MLDLAAGWRMDVERGPEWLFVRLHAPHDSGGDASGLAESVWGLMQQHFCQRIVLEMQDVPFLFSSLIGQLVMLNKRVHASGGLLRVAGFTPAARDVLAIARLDTCFPEYANREEAMLGYRPMKPR